MAGAAELDGVIERGAVELGVTFAAGDVVAASASSNWSSKSLSSRPFDDNTW
jgi:hypothetical protein